MAAFKKTYMSVCSYKDMIFWEKQQLSRIKCCSCFGDDGIHRLYYYYKHFQEKELNMKYIHL